jgi:nitroreductase
MMAMAVTAPDHGSLRPFRFIRIADAARERLAFLFQEIRRRAEPNVQPADLERDREKALNGPCLIAVVGRVRHDHPKVPVSEQYASIGAGVMAVLVAAHLLGYGAIMLSGDRVRDPALREALGIDAAEALVGFITIGTVGSSPSVKQRAAPEEYVSTWHGTTATGHSR